MQWAGVGVNLFSPTGHQVCAVAGLDLKFRILGGGGRGRGRVEEWEEEGYQGVAKS